ncbi:2-aminoethylphosphonate--pyruvate transaminase [Nymphon striatum]|nr:2-aminoethylphosphonate--pyruvate transaminase [Nymphon striatum]
MPYPELGRQSSNRSSDCWVALATNESVIKRVFIPLEPARALLSPKTTNRINLTLSVSEQKKLFTPGPLCVSQTVKEAMLTDYGSRDVQFIDTVKYIRSKLVEIAGVSSSSFSAVPLQGSGSYAVEAVLQTVTSRENGKILILANGAYGKRMDKMCEVSNLPRKTILFPENEKVDPKVVERELKADQSYTCVAIVHCETSSGVINPVESIGKLTKDLLPNAAYFVDAMSSFGAIPLDIEESKVDYLVSSANKCLEGVPGFSYAIARISHLLTCEGFCRSYSLDLVDQYKNLEKTSQFRFTPPTHTMLAFKQALVEYERDGGIAGRAGRYQANRKILRDGMKAIGFKELLDDSHEGYIITSFYFPKDKNFDFSVFYQKLSDLGQVIYPGKVLNADCFRIGNIGNIYPEDMHHLMKCVLQVLTEMNVEVPVRN